MKLLSIMLFVITFCLAFIGWRLLALDAALRDYLGNTELVIRSNQDLIQQNSRLAQELVNLQKQVESFKDSLQKR